MFVVDVSFMLSMDMVPCHIYIYSSHQQCPQGKPLNLQGRSGKCMAPVKDVCV